MRIEDSFSTAYSVSSSSESGTMDDSFDAVTAMKSALSFLCRINADYKEVKRFLVRYPEALLFEGAQMEDKDSVRSPIERQMKHCKCFVPACNENRRKILALLNKGFGYYRGIMLMKSLEDDAFLRNISGGGNWHFYSEQLQALERDVRGIGEKDLVVRRSITETRGSVKLFRSQLEGVSRQETGNRSALKLLRCQRNTHMFERRSVLEHTLGVATLSIASLEKELELLGQERIAATRLQTALLNNAFAGCHRHVCEASRNYEFD